MRTPFFGQPLLTYVPAQKEDAGLGHPERVVRQGLQLCRGSTQPRSRVPSLTCSLSVEPLVNNRQQRMPTCQQPYIQSFAQGTSRVV